MDIAELGYKVDSSGLVEGTKALDENAAAADRAGGAADRLDREYSALARTVERSSSALGDRLGGALDRIGTGTGAVITELQSLNRTNTEILASLGALDGKLTSIAAQAQAYGAAGAAAAASTVQVTTASQQLEKQLADQDARLKGVAQRAMEWAASNREANLSERALAEAARDAALGIDRKARALAGAGSEQDRVVARARALEEAEARAANEVRQAAAAAEAQQINLKQLLGQIDPTVGALNRLAAMEDRLERAHKAGLINPAVFDQYQAKIDAARASILNATGAQNGMAMSARQLQNNLRMIPMQVTDITTSLISGQPAWMVAIQQGGQLKDQFGGIGPAARAVGGYVLGLINPVTLAAAALAALAIAAKQSEDQLFEFQRAQILSGQGAAVGAAGFLELASSIDHLQGVSRGGAVDALTETAKAGRFAGEQFEMVAAAAARMEASTGRSAHETVRAFESIAQEPVEGLLKLNDAERFLTAAQLQRIVALKEEGRMQQAASEAMQIFAAHLNDVADRTEAVMPEMSKGWRDIKDDISGAWGALGSFTSAVVDLAGEWGVLARMPRLSDVLGLGVAGGALVKWSGLPSLSKVLNDAAAAMRGLPPLPKPIDEGGALDPQAARDMAAQPEATRQWNRRLEMYDKQLKMGAEVERIEAEGIAAGRTRAEIEATIANYMKSQEESAKRTTGTGKTARSGVEQLLARVQQQISANDELARSGQRVSQSQRLIEEIDIRLADGKGTLTHAERRLLETERERLAMSHDIATVAQQNERDMAAQAALIERLTQLEKQRRQQAEIDLIGLSRGGDATAMLQRRLDIQRKYLDEQKALDKEKLRGTLSGGEYQAEVALLQASLDRSLEIERGYQEQRLAMLGDWRAGARRAWEDYAFAASNALEQANGLMNTALSGWEDAWVRFAQTGKLSFRDMANAIVADLARIAAKQAAVGIINAVAGAWGGGVTAAGNAAATSGTHSINAGLLASYGGGRATGGPVAADSFYQVGEGGKPELFRQNGRTYLIPGDNGAVIPAAPTAGTGSASTGSGSVVSVRVVVNSDGSTDVSAETPVWQRFGKEIGQLIDMKINEAQVRSMKDGGAMRVMGAGR
ncbi:phage tail tape measure protein [Stenotrophomonas pavanii]|uniref:phage tail tape measure protein n=1 Tax=Stenotrophomonas pavanii TaxID=487698 RepID=UPI000CCFDB7F|nr:phage tail tape measure protein [Stenotrophomonas pavanii]PNY71481.1 phage tail tape measure protein [Stenotrophomonas pavanii]